jgi:hypothetical protein
VTGRTVRLPCGKIEWHYDAPEGNGNPMSIVVAANFADGVVLGADTSVNIPGPPSDYQEPLPPGVAQFGNVLKVFEGRETLVPLGQRPIGIAMYGTPQIGNRSIESHLHEFITRDPNGVISGETTVQAVAEELRTFFADLHERIVLPFLEGFRKRPYDQIPEQERPGFGFVLAGYSAKSYLGEIWQVYVPTHKEAIQLRKPGDYSLNWIGSIDQINRYMKGYSDEMLAELRQYLEKTHPITFSSEQNEINSILAKSEYIIPTTVMPLAVGIEFVRFLVQLTIDHHRFAMGPAYVAGGPKIGVVSYAGKPFEILEMKQ